MIIGYARVSTEDQIIDRQMDQLLEAGAKKIFKEKISGTKLSRPELNKMFDQLREGDVVLVTELSRLSRSTKDLFFLTEQLQLKGADVKSLKETWLDTTTPTGRLMFTFMAGLSQFERDLISQKTKEGLASARRRGRYGGRPPKLDNGQKQMITILYNEKEMSVNEICKQFKISRPTLYKAIAANRT